MGGRVIAWIVAFTILAVGLLCAGASLLCMWRGKVGPLVVIATIGTYVGVFIGVRLLSELLR